LQCSQAVGLIGISGHQSRAVVPAPEADLTLAKPPAKRVDRGEAAPEVRRSSLPAALFTSAMKVALVSEKASVLALELMNCVCVMVEGASVSLDVHRLL
jgi:hypothetical protein